jgi:hypothetical protein
MRNVTIMAAVAALLVPCALPVMGQEETDYQRDRKSQEDFRLPLEIKTGQKACYQVICRKSGVTAIPGSDRSDRPGSESGEKDHTGNTGLTRVTRPGDDAGDTWTFTLEPTRGNTNGNAMVTVTVAPGSRDANARDDGDEHADHTMAAKSERTYLVEVDRAGRIVRCDRQGLGAVANDPAKPDERPVGVGTREVPVSADEQDGEVKMSLACIFGSGLHERTLTTGQVYELDTGAALGRKSPYGSDSDRPDRSGDRSGDRPDRTARPFNTATDATTPRIGLKFTGVTGEPRDENADDAASRKGRLANFSVVPFSSSASSPRIGGNEDSTNPDRAATAVTAAGAQVSGTASYHADTGCLESLNVSMGSSITAPTTPDAGGTSAKSGGKWISIRYQASEEKDDDKDGDKDDK